MSHNLTNEKSTLVLVMVCCLQATSHYPSQCCECWSRSVSPYGVTMPSYDYILHWRHNGRDGVSNHQPHHCLLNRLFRPRSRKTSKLHVTGLCAGNSPVTGEFPAQMASSGEDVSIRWRHHELNRHVLSAEASPTKTQEFLFYLFRIDSLAEVL